MRVTIYRNYRFIDKDPIIDAVRTVVKMEEKLNNSQVEAISGVTATTISNWFEGGTRKPQNATVTQVTAALGYARRDSLNKDGSVNVGFTKIRELDYRDEIEKQANWFLKHSKRKRKANGRGK